MPLNKISRLSIEINARINAKCINALMRVLYK